MVWTPSSQQEWSSVLGASVNLYSSFFIFSEKKRKVVCFSHSQPLRNKLSAAQSPLVSEDIVTKDQSYLSSLLSLHLQNFPIVTLTSKLASGSGLCSTGDDGRWETVTAGRVTEEGLDLEMGETQSWQQVVSNCREYHSEVLFHLYLSVLSRDRLLIDSDRPLSLLIGCYTCSLPHRWHYHESKRWMKTFWKFWIVLWKNITDSFVK